MTGKKFLSSLTLSQQIILEYPSVQFHLLPLSYNARPNQHQVNTVTCNSIKQIITTMINKFIVTIMIIIIIYIRKLILIQYYSLSHLKHRLYDAIKVRITQKVWQHQ